MQFPLKTLFSLRYALEFLLFVLYFPLTFIQIYAILLYVNKLSKLRRERF